MVMLITLVRHARVPPFNCGQHSGRGLSPTPLFILGASVLVHPEGMATKVSGRAAVSVSHTNSIAVNPSETFPSGWSHTFSFHLPLPAILAPLS